MMSHGYNKTSSDHCVFTRKFPNDDFIILLLYVDDMLIIGHDSSKIDRLKRELVTTPELGPTRLADPDRNSGDARPKPLIKSIYQIHFINISIFILKSLRKEFQFRASP